MYIVTSVGGEGDAIWASGKSLSGSFAKRIILKRGLDGFGFLRQHWNMNRKGDIRSDGKVFFGKNKNCIGGEYWMEMDHFLKTCGQDYYERRDAYQKYLVEMSRTKDARALKKRERQRGLGRECMARKRKENPEKFREIDRKYRSSRKDDPIFLERQRVARRRHYYKINAEKIAKRKEAKQAKANEDKAKRIEKNERLIERSKKKEAAALVKSLRPKRVVLTEEQRKEAKRQGKRNYKHVRRARINSCEVKATPKIIEEARKNAGDRCYYCGRKSKLTLDHFDPLAKGGAHCISNLVFACFSCNSRKRDLDPFEFMASNVAISF